jgi:hypothetical protein
MKTTRVASQLSSMQFPIHDMLQQGHLSLTFVFVDFLVLLSICAFKFHCHSILLSEPIKVKEGQFKVQCNSAMYDFIMI